MCKRVVLVFITLLMLGGICHASNDRFVYLGTSNSVGQYYFDTESLKFGRGADGKIDPYMIDVWIKVVYSDSGKQMFLNNLIKYKSSTKEYEDIHHNLGHYLIDVRNRKHQLLGYSFYSSEGHIATWPMNDPVWLDMVPASTMETNAGLIGNWILKNMDTIYRRST
ncbi:MAG: hypothetical protein H6Q68_3648 [Firmicutes bacterium]|nr:hypothetical protein [Bacillota bacterium]